MASKCKFKITDLIEIDVLNKRYQFIEYEKDDELNLDGFLIKQFMNKDHSIQLTIRDPDKNQVIYRTIQLHNIENIAITNDNLESLINPQNGE